MKIALNFLPLKVGGGVQVALDFLRNAVDYGNEYEWFLVCREHMKFSEYCNNVNIFLLKEVKDNHSSRFVFEYFMCGKIMENLNPDVIYTQFGPQWPSIKYSTVSGCAYSNLFYPGLDC